MGGVGQCWKRRRDDGEVDIQKKKTGRVGRTESGRMWISMMWSHSPDRKKERNKEIKKQTNKNRKHRLDRLH